MKRDDLITDIVDSLQRDDWDRRGAIETVEAYTENNAQAIAVIIALLIDYKIIPAKAFDYEMRTIPRQGFDLDDESSN